MSDYYLRFVKEELSLRKLQPLPRLSVEEIENVIRKALLGVHMYDADAVDTLLETMRKIQEDVELLAAIRFVKGILGAEIGEESVDKGVLELLRSLLKYEVAMLSPTVMKFHGAIFVKFAKSCEISGRKYRAGDIALLGPEEYLYVVINKCGDFLVEPLMRVQEAGRK